MVKAVSKDEVLFQTLTEPLPELGNKEIASSCPTDSGIIDFVRGSFCSCKAWIYIFIFLKVRKLQALIVILKSEAPVKPDLQAASFISNLLLNYHSSAIWFDLIMQSWNHASSCFNNLVTLFLLYKFHLQEKKHAYTNCHWINSWWWTHFHACPQLTPLCIILEKSTPYNQIFFTSTFQHQKMKEWTDFTVTNIFCTQTITTKLSLD